MKTGLKKMMVVGCALFLGGLLAGKTTIAQEKGVVKDELFVRTASPSFEFPVRKPFKVQKPQFNEIFRVVNPQTRLPVTISIYDLKTDVEAAAQYETLKNRVTDMIGNMGFCSRIDRKPVIKIDDYNGYPAFSYDFDCRLKGGRGVIQTNLLAIVKDGKFISLFAMTAGDIDQMKMYLKDIDL